MRPFTIVVVVAVLSAGCLPNPRSGSGFTLPDGNADQGKETFVALQCHACHTVDGVELEAHDAQADRMIALGGEKSTVQTYGKLVTSIINPSHRFAPGYRDEDVKENGQSKMYRYNDEMTITQLMDLVAFLQAHYRLREYQSTRYRPYP